MRRWLVSLGLLAAAVPLAASQQRAEPSENLTIEGILRIPRMHGYELAPDGERAAAAISVLGLEKIWVISDPEKIGIPVAPAEGADREPDWSPDGNEVAFASNRTGSWHVFVAKPGDEGARQITTTARIADRAGPQTEAGSRTCLVPPAAARAGTSGSNPHPVASRFA